MAIFALSSSSSLPNPNLFTPLPSSPSPPPPPPPNDPVSSSTIHSISPPIPIPKYPPPQKPQTKPKHKALKTTHRNSHYFKPVKPGEVIPRDPNRSIIISESGVSYQLPGAPFEFQYSYSETPKAKPLALREPAFLPFAPPSMARPWTGKAPLKKTKGKEKKVPLFHPFNPASPGEEEVKHMEMPVPLWYGKFPKDGRSREEVLGLPLKKWEVRMLIQPMLSDNRQVNLGE